MQRNNKIDLERKKLIRQFLLHISDMIRKGWRVYVIDVQSEQRSIERLMTKKACLVEVFEPFTNVIFVRDRYEQG